MNEAPAQTKIRISVLLDRDVDDKANAAARAAGRSKSNWIAALVTKAVARAAAAAKG